jgi:hypothetical protein
MAPSAESARVTAAWNGFKPGLWQKHIDVRDFIQQNYEPYDGDEAFLAGATPRTEKLWSLLQALFVEERAKGVLDISQIPAGLGNVARVDVLPFHQMGRFKWEKLGLTYELGDVKPPAAEEIERALALFRAEGLKAC